MTAIRYRRPAANSATVGSPGVIKAVRWAPGTQRSAERNSRHGSGIGGPCVHVVRLPVPGIEVTAPDHQGRFGLLQQCCKARKVGLRLAVTALVDHERSVAMLGRMGPAGCNRSSKATVSHITQSLTKLVGQARRSL